MKYIYDIILNFTDENYPYEFYEWEENDFLEHIKKIPIIKISPEYLDEIINYQIIISNEILNQIKNKTLLYQNNKVLEYAIVLTDLNQVIALEFDKTGNVISKSKLLLDEEDAIISECSSMEEYKIDYIKKEKYPSKKFLTRKEQQRQRYLIIEVNNMYKEKHKDKLNYIYYELYGNNKKNINEKYIEIIKDLKENYSDKHNDIYELLRLNFSKK